MHNIYTGITVDAEPTLEALQLATREFIEQGPGGRRTFRDYMGFCLFGDGYVGPYDPAKIGYYSSGRVEIGRHFDTAPEAGPYFAIRMVEKIIDVWRVLGSDDEFTVVEQGAGNGTLARNVFGELENTAPYILNNFRYVIVEKSPALQDKQAKALKGIAAVEWRDEGDLSPYVGMHVSNELLDTFPVHRVRKNDGELEELYLSVRDGEITEEWDTPSKIEELDTYLRTAYDQFQGETVVNLEMLSWFNTTAANLRNGCIIAVDYPYVMGNGDYPSLRTYGLGNNADIGIYARSGALDITADVDFGVLRNYAAASGLVDKVRVASFKELFGYDIDDKSLYDSMREREWIMHNKPYRMTLNHSHIGEYNMTFGGYKVFVASKNM
jgi:SAM-dependent MidA family methyltransferase